MSVNRLMSSPLFGAVCWSCLPLHDGTWTLLPPDTLGPDHATFLAAVKQLDMAGFPPDSPVDLDGAQFRVALGLDSSLSHLIPASKTYNDGRALAWECLLHFQVLDLLLAHDHPNVAVQPYVTPSLQKSTSAAKFLKELIDWNSHARKFTGQLAPHIAGDISPSSAPNASTDSNSHPSQLEAGIESLISVLHLSDIEGETLTSKTFKNLQAMAAGLMWVLELGTDHAPAIDTTGRIALRPSDPVQARYARVASSVQLEKLKNLGKVEKLLRPLSYMINISPTLVFVNLDLQALHVDVVVQHQIRHYLAVSQSDLAALRYMEDCLQAVVRTICTAQVPARDVILEHFSMLTKDMPAPTAADGKIFKDLRRRIQNDYRQHTIDASVPSALNAAALASYRIRPPAMAIDSRIVQRVGPLAHGLSLISLRLSPLTAFTQPLPMTVVPEVAVIEPEETPMQVAETFGTVPGQTLSVTEVTSQLADPGGANDEVNNVESGVSARGLIHRCQLNVGYPTVFRVELLNKLNETDVVDEQPELPVQVAVAGGNQPRRSARVKAAQDSNSKRKCLSQPGPPTTKKSKSQSEAGGNHAEEERDPQAMQVEEDRDPQGLDSDWADPKRRNRWYHDLATVANIKRSNRAVRISGLLPDGRTQQDFDYIGHLDSEETEYRLIYDVTTSMASVRERCSQNGVLYTQYDLGDVVGSLNIHKPYLLCMQSTAWQSMSDPARVSLWATGRDLFVRGLTAGPKVEDERSELTRGHRMDAPIEVQVQGLRVPPESDDDDAEADYTSSIRTTTLNTMLDHAARPDGLVLNALNLPSGHFVHPNPLLGTGFDLEVMAYTKTNGITGFHSVFPAYNETYFQLFGLGHCFSIFHVDITAAWIYVMGPAAKFWVRSRPKDGQDDIMHSHAFDDWDPDQANLETHEYEVTVLPAGEGVFLQQPGRRHAVIGAGSTVTTGGYFFCASSMRPAIGVILHMVMLQHVLTNAGHVTMWPIFIRISMFWLECTMFDPPADRLALAAYLPDLTLSHARGWMDIVYLSCLVCLFPCLDHRGYEGSGVPANLLVQAGAVSAKYEAWRTWVASQYVCEGPDGPLDWESDIFTVRFFGSLAASH
ncbi:hypothetical protein DFH06DRAFT_1319668 [Mycena polygramma]|nr:hypothetical protein DFH06DRAFT_1319668 [Mycena polygramma]